MTGQQLQQQAAHNHTELFYFNATSNGGEITTKKGLKWTWAGTGKESMVPFPAMNDEDAGALLDEMMDYYRARAVKGTGCWSLQPSQPADLDIKLLARGFQPGWQPCWMALDLQAINTGYAVPDGLKVTADNTTSTAAVKNLPYNGGHGAVSTALLQQHPRLAQRFIATLDGKIVGHSCVFFTTGEHRTAGIYNVGVVPRARNKGIGKAVVTAACLFAKEQGYDYATLNGTGRRMYEQIGFRWIGYGLTWWLMSDRYITAPPSKEQVALAEATGKGDIGALEIFAQQLTANDLSAPIANGMTLTQLAIHCKQEAVAEWLVAHGALYTVHDAWELKWKDRAAALLKENPQLANGAYGDAQITLLHIAAQNHDLELAQLVLSANPDLSITDKVYNATALGWAEHLGAVDVAELIRSYKGIGNL